MAAHAHARVPGFRTAGATGVTMFFALWASSSRRAWSRSSVDGPRRPAGLRPPAGRPTGAGVGGAPGRAGARRCGDPTLRRAGRVAAASAVVVLAARNPVDGAWYSHWGLAPAGLAAVVLVARLPGDLSGLGGVLEHPALVRVGQLSYGLYLGLYPVMVWARPRIRSHPVQVLVAFGSGPRWRSPRSSWWSDRRSAASPPAGRQNGARRRCVASRHGRGTAPARRAPHLQPRRAGAGRCRRRRGAHRRGRRRRRGRAPGDGGRRGRRAGCGGRHPGHHEHFGSMAGQFKDFLELVFYPCVDHAAAGPGRCS